MRGKARNRECSLLFQYFSCLDQGACSVDDIVDDDGLLALNAADQVHCSDLSCSFSLFDYHCKRGFLDSDGGK